MRHGKIVQCTKLLNLFTLENRDGGGGDRSNL